MTSSRPANASPTERRTATFLLRQPRVTQGFREPLDPTGQSADAHPSPALAGDSVALTMLWIPPGSFTMGAADGEPESSDSERPQRQVSLAGFFLGQTPITQAQWRAVAMWKERQGERWGPELNPNPSHFQTKEMKMGDNRPRSRNLRLLKGETTTDQRPVECVNWEEAMEFCQRLSQRTGRFYTLPTEAQWEYACRAGNGTPFAFGETLTAELANYKAEETDAKGPKGEDRRQTTPVGMFPANAWGLHDMHGNVWEWCLDHWHDSYKGAPEDGSAWLIPGENSLRGEKDIGGGGKDSGGGGKDSGGGGEGSSGEVKGRNHRRPRRGGSWDDHPVHCRSASRDHLAPYFADPKVGFRVVCLPQGSTNSPSNL